MPISKTKMKNAAIAAKSAALPKLPKELLDQSVSSPMTDEAVNPASMAFKKALFERALGAELRYRQGYPKANQFAILYEERFSLTCGDCQAFGRRVLALGQCEQVSLLGMEGLPHIQRRILRPTPI